MRIRAVGYIPGILVVGDAGRIGVEPESGVTQLRFPVSYADDTTNNPLAGFFLYRVQGAAVVDLPVNGARPADPDIRLPAAALARRVTAADRAQAGFPQDVPEGAVIAEFNIPAGQVTGEIVMDVLADDLAEPAESVELSVLNFRVGPRPYIPGDGKTSAVGRIGSNDSVEIDLAAPAADTAEGNSILFPLSLGGGRFAGTLRVVYSVAPASGSTATGADYDDQVLNGDFQIRLGPDGPDGGRRYSVLDSGGTAVPSLQNRASLSIPILALLDSVTEAGGEGLTLTLDRVTALAADGMAADLPVRVGAASADANIVDGMEIEIAINGGADGSMTFREGQTAEIPVSLSGAFTSPVTLVCEFDSRADEAQPREDYELGRVLTERRGRFEAECGTIAAGAASASIRIPLLRETVLETGFDAVEGDEDFVVVLTTTLLGGQGTVDDGPEYTITIADLPANRVALSAERAEIMESQSLSFTVALSGTATSSSVSVPISLAGIPAAQLAVTGVPAAPGVNNYLLTFAAAASGDASGTGSFNVAVTDNNSVEAMRSLQVVLGAPSGGGGAAREFVLAGSPLSVSVVDNDGAVVTLTPATRAGVSASEGGNARFAVQASQAPANNVTVNYSLGADGDTAVRGVDYSGGAGGSVTLAAGTTAVNIDIPVTADARPEGVERFSLRLTGVSGDADAALGLAAELGAVATIARSDPVSVAVTADPATVTEGQAVSFGIALSTGGSPVSFDEALVLNYSLPATATAVPNLADMVGDYAPPPGYAGGAMRAGQAGVAAGSSSASLLVTTIQDGAQEGAETIVLRVDSVRSLAGNPVDPVTGIEFRFGADATATATIQASMTTASLGLADVQFALDPPSAATAAEGESVTFALRRSGSLPASLTFSDYAAASNMPRISLGYSVSGVDAADIASIAVAGGSFAQNPETISAAGDLTGRMLQINVAASANPSIIVALASDTVAEAAETLTLTLDSLSYPATTNGWTDLAGFMAARPNAYGLSTRNRAQVEIEAHGRPVFSVTLDRRTVDEESLLTISPTDSEPRRRIAFLVELAANSIASTTTFTVAYTLSGTATAGADYSTTANLVAGGMVTATGVSGSFMIVQPASATAVSRTFGLLFGGNDDSLSEPEETVVLTLTSIGPANSAHIDADRSQATYEIPPSDPVAASVAARFDTGVTMATEGGAGNAGMARFRISLSGDVAVPLAVEYALTGTAMRTAAADGDYRAAADRGRAMFDALTRTADLAFPIIDDALSEAQETLIFTLSSVDTGRQVGGAPVSIASAQNQRAASVPIAASDPVTVSLATAASAVTEGNTVVFTVRQRGGTTVVPTVVAYTVSGTGITRADYRDDNRPDMGMALTGTLNIPAGQADAAISLNIVDDMSTESGESLTLTLDSATLTDPDGVGGTIGLAGAADRSASVSLSDPTAVSTRNVSVVATSASATAEGATAVFTVSLAEANPHSQLITVDWAVSATSATGDDDAEAADFDFDGDSNPDANFPTGQTLSFAVGETMKTINVPILDDSLRESLESYTVAISNLVASAMEADPTQIAVAQAQGTIAASDPISYTISAPAADTSVAEGSTLTVTVTGTAAPGGTGGNIGCAITGDSSSSRDATETADFDSLSATAAFAAADTSADCMFVVTDDPDDEGEEFFTVTLSNPGSGGIANAVATDTRNFRIAASDGATPQTPAPTASAGSDASATDGSTVTLSGSGTRGGGDTTSTLGYAWLQVTSESDPAVLTTAGAITNADAASATFTAPNVSSDTEFFFQLTVTATASGETPSSASDTVRITVTDDDSPTATISTAGASVTEGGQTMLASTVTDATDSTDTITAAWTASPTSPAVSFDDAASTAPTVTWPMVTANTDYTLTLTATDSAGNTG
ncbi:MAG: hypothetical protein OXU61_00700, partial [Gammaproteobacteria bacterium]|nr:hypothetical protein [Gammaproteobacteria bacterium]